MYARCRADGPLEGTDNSLPVICETHLTMAVSHGGVSERGRGAPGVRATPELGTGEIPARACGRISLNRQPRLEIPVSLYFFVGPATSCSSSRRAFLSE